MGERFVSDRQLADRYGVSRPSIWRWVMEKSFPAPVKLLPGCTRWPLTSIEQWEKKLLLESAHT